MNQLFYSIISAIIVSLLSLVGILFLAVKEKVLNKIIFYLVSFSTGAFLGGAFFHLLPESIEEFGEPANVFVFSLIGFSLFFILERLLRWHHCHESECDIHSKKHLGVLNLIGDGVHNMIDGIIIFSAFSVSPVLGLPIVISIAMHEIPQEIGDFGILIYSGFDKGKAILFNLLSALTAIIGVFLGWFLVGSIDNFNNFLLPFAAGGFIYIASSDLIPELHKEYKLAKSLLSFTFFIVALFFMWFIR